MANEKIIGQTDIKGYPVSDYVLETRSYRYPIHLSQHDIPVVGDLKGKTPGQDAVLMYGVSMAYKRCAEDSDFFSQKYVLEAPQFPVDHWILEEVGLIHPAMKGHLPDRDKWPGWLTTTVSAVHPDEKRKMTVTQVPRALEVKTQEMQCAITSGVYTQVPAPEGLAIQIGFRNGLRHGTYDSARRVYYGDGVEMMVAVHADQLSATYVYSGEGNLIRFYSPVTGTIDRPGRSHIDPICRATKQLWGKNAIDMIDGIKPEETVKNLVIQMERSTPLQERVSGLVVFK
ncbi:hypothetical protein HGB07_03695 [Candidatus Roizmanbacteria bacterium]|nr:hypothetical protein [Candidatus Roizmanbacteria bacterium]